MHGGPVLALAAAASFGGTTAAAKALLGDVEPFMLAGLLYLGAGLGMAVIVASRKILKRESESAASLGRADLPWLTGAVVFGGILAPLLLMWGLLRTPASSASLLLNMEGVFTVLLAWLALRENVGPRVLLGVMAILGGSALLSMSPGGDVQQDLLGKLAITGACLGWAVDNTLTRRISGGDPVLITGVKGLVAGGVNISLAIFLGQAIPGVKALALSELIGFIGYGASLVLFVLALRSMGAARTGALFSTAPFIGTVAAVVFLKEGLSPVLFPAAILMGAGVWLQLGERHHHEHVHEPIVHAHVHSHDEHHHHAHEDLTGDNRRHTHLHAHERLIHSHFHYPDSHHGHGH
jgi:drug/metabolite transporter (DMT)-like permease